MSSPSQLPNFASVEDVIEEQYGDRLADRIEERLVPDRDGSWSGNSWSGNSWSGNSWGGNSWGGNSWGGNSWGSNSWS